MERLAVIVTLQYLGLQGEMSMYSSSVFTGRDTRLVLNLFMGHNSMLMEFIFVMFVKIFEKGILCEFYINI